MTQEICNPAPKQELTEEEEIMVKWRTGQFGSFYKALMDAIFKADPTNRAQLVKAFPAHVSAVERYGNEPGWWPMVMRKAIALGYPGTLE